jgi:CRP-like cAMP-binding protein
MKSLKSGCDLNTCLLCRLCKKEWIPAVALHRTNHKHTKGQVIFKENEEVKGIFFVYDGTVKVHKHWGNNKELILRFAKKGNIMGHRGLGEDLMYPVSGTAIESTTTCFFPLDFFQASLKVNYDFLYELMQFFATELKESERNMRNLAHMPARNRIAQALLTLEEKFGTTGDNYINIAISRQDLASFAGTTYETVFRVLNELISEKLIDIDEKQLRILNRDILIKNLKQ